MDDCAFFAERSREMVRRWSTTSAASSYAEIDAPHGPDAFLLDEQRYMSVVGELYNRIGRAEQRPHRQQ